MRITRILERSVRVSRYANPGLASDLTTSIVAVVSDVVRAGQPLVGFGFSSFGRFAQGGLIRERFAPRLLAAQPESLLADSGETIDPFRAWDCIAMKNRVVMASVRWRLARLTWLWLA